MILWNSQARQEAYFGLPTMHTDPRLLLPLQPKLLCLITLQKNKKKERKERKGKEMKRKEKKRKEKKRKEIIH